MIVTGVLSDLLTVLAIAAACTLHTADATLEQVASQGSDPVSTSVDATTKTTTTYIVSFSDNDVAPAKRCAALAKSTGGTVQHLYEHVLNGCSLTLPLTQAQSAFTALSSSPVVRSVEEDQEVSIYYEGIEEETVFDVIAQDDQVNAQAVPSWGLDRINQCALPLDQHVDKQYATGVKVFIIDTGIYAEHEEFADIISKDDCHFSVFSGEAALSDGHGHG